MYDDEPLVMLIVIAFFFLGFAVGRMEPPIDSGEWMTRFLQSVVTASG